MSFNSRFQISNFKLLVICFLTLFCVAPAVAQTFSAAKYYQLADGNEWRYTAPPGWKEGDYVSRIVENKNGFPEFLREFQESAKSSGYEARVKFKGAKFFRHYDATKAAKLLVSVDDNIFYYGEEFAGGDSIAWFDSPVLWFPAKLKVGDETNEKRNFVRIYKDGRKQNGTFEIKQKIAAVETVNVTAGIFKDCLRVESETFWELGDGRRARSINVYHYAITVGVVKASARFIVMNEAGKELINRLVETDLKSARINGKSFVTK